MKLNPLDACIAVLLTIVVAFSLVDCRDPNTPTPDADAKPQDDAQNPPIDGVGDSPCLRSCARLGALGCPEAHPATGSCEDTCDRVTKLGASTYDPSCVSAARDVAAVRACPAVRCVLP